MFFVLNFFLRFFLPFLSVTITTNLFQHNLMAFMDRKIAKFFFCCSFLLFTFYACEIYTNGSYNIFSPYLLIILYNSYKVRISNNFLCIYFLFKFFYEQYRKNENFSINFSLMLSSLENFWIKVFIKLLQNFLVCIKILIF